MRLMQARVVLVLLPLAVVLAAACGGGGSGSPSAPAEPVATSAPASGAEAAAPESATPSPTGTADPAWWEDEEATPPGPPQSRVWNVRVEALSATEVAVSFDYHLDIAPEANVFVHMGLLPNFAFTLLDADGEPLDSAAGEIDPTEFGDDTVGGQASFTVRTERFADVRSTHICIKVVTGNYDDFAGRSEAFCEPVPIDEKMEP